MSPTTIDKNHRITLPDSIRAAADLKPNDQIEWRVEDAEIRGCKFVAEKAEETFPRGSLRKYLTPERDQAQLAILTGCVQLSAERK